MSDSIKDTYNEIVKALNPKKHNCFKCNGIKETSDCKGEEYLQPEGEKICSWYLIAQNDLIKYKNNNPTLTLGVMLNTYMKEKRLINE